MTTKRRVLSPGLRLFFVLLLAPSTLAMADEPLDQFDEYVQTAMKQWQVPGLAIAVIRDDKVVHARGYGVRKFGERAPVTPKTFFPIGSCTKCFTATAIGLLVDDGKLGWDDTVQKHLPDFELSEPFLTREVTIRDLLAHRTGLELGNYLWSKNEFSQDAIMHRLRHLKPKYSFRSRYTYNNLMYLVAGRVVEKVSGKSWAEFITSRILRPIEMRSSTTLLPSEATNVAWPHAKLDGRVGPIDLERTYDQSIAPAGSIWSNTTEMANWVRLNLADGQFGRRVIQTKTLSEMHSPQVVIRGTSSGRVYPKQNFRSHGIGWFVDDYRSNQR